MEGNPFLLNSNCLTEIRFLGNRTWSIYTSDPALITEALARPEVAGLNAYQILNPLILGTPEKHGAPRDVLFRAGRGQLSCDADVDRRTWLLLDSDVVKPTGSAATDCQRDAAQTHSLALEGALTAEGWPRPIACSSGNGAHRLYRLNDFTNDSETTFLISNLLRTLARKFDSDLVKLDKSVSNAGRLTRLYGSFNRKAGRLSSVLSIPDPITPVGADQIKALVDKWRKSFGYVKPLTQREGEWTAKRMEALLDFHNVGYLGPVRKTQGLLWVLSPCPFNSDHSGSSPAVMITKQGWPKFKCLHNSCQGKGWKAFLAHLNITSGKVFPWKSSNCENKSARF